MDIPTSKIVDVSWKFGGENLTYNYDTCYRLPFKLDNKAALLVKYNTFGLYQSYLFTLPMETPINEMNHKIEMYEAAGWRVRVTSASSESDKVGKTFLQLRLLLDEGGKTTSVFTEMTLGQFYKFLHDLEKAKKSLDLLV